MNQILILAVSDDTVPFIYDDNKRNLGSIIDFLQQQIQILIIIQGICKILFKIVAKALMN